MLIVALTGGIGSGKSAVADGFARHGVPIIDTDLIARELVAPGQPALKEITAQFGDAVLTADGRLDRERLREIVFADPARRRALEQILHPRIREEVRRRLDGLPGPYCLVVIPLLAETGDYPFVDRVLLVEADEETRIRRTMARDGLSREQVEQIVASQSSPAQRRALADDIIDNSHDLEHLEQQIAALHETYQTLAGTN
ncbi:dephospho-CoA kinase [Thiohalophilus thiocyanatoxydans]|uniref:Dephospho-CoA kinase n=1 Tax=Thiohalophilus thiocyanatoxydans TaxID=381308 RepID=A0A4V3H3Y7_9GAMM|nr:dephospho-CoA kinase [Thiohalophilus thiocyanatoxydans]TDY01165.1 dephospho-CoA kinase [Thiohalophilus thiocyanatoxydans]